MVQSVPEVASSSVPDLRVGRSWIKVLLGFAGVAIVATVVAVVLLIKTGDDPGRNACHHLDDLAEHDARWDRFVDALVRTVEHRAYHSVRPKLVRIGPGSRYDRCFESFEVIREVISYSKYTSLSACVSKATTWRDGSTCFDNF